MPAPAAILPGMVAARRGSPTGNARPPASSPPIVWQSGVLPDWPCRRTLGGEVLSYSPLLATDARSSASASRKTIRKAERERISSATHSRIYRLANRPRALWPRNAFGDFINGCVLVLRESCRSYRLP